MWMDWFWVGWDENMGGWGLGCSWDRVRVQAAGPGCMQMAGLGMQSG